jgi:hypothetical protein
MRSVLLALAAAACAAQEDPQMVWEGEVDGTVLLRFHGNRVDAEEERGLPVQRQRVRFYERLPERRQNVRMEVIEGRGRARIVEQPRPENNYTLAVRVEDREGGSSRYSLEFYWEGRGGGFRLPETPRWSGVARENSLSWMGRVDDEVVVSCRRNSCEAEAVRGQQVARDRFRFSDPLPERDVTVSLEDTSGRGEIRLVEQPRERNDYTARVLIRDRDGGSGDYSFTLAWTPPPRGDRGFDFARRGLVWSGRVDGRVRVIVEGNSVSTQALSGRPVEAERADFARGLPRRDSANATVRKLRGRGRIEIVEYPSRRNDYRLVFEIDDSDGGTDNYQVEVGW